MRRWDKGDWKGRRGGDGDGTDIREAASHLLSCLLKEVTSLQLQSFFFLASGSA